MVEATHPGQMQRRILISGATGLIGRRLVAARRAAGDLVVPLSRRPLNGDEIIWSPGAGTLDPGALSGFDTVIHLAGEPVLGRWTSAKKQRIFESRARGTAELATALAASAQPPRQFLCASGINFYGDHGATVIDESFPPGGGFLAKVCQAWEEASAPLAASTQVVNLRIGVVLATEGGTLAAMLPLFRLGLGGVIAGGRAYISWITLDDLVRVVDHLITTSQLSGPINVVAPAPVTGREWTSALASSLKRPAIFPVPAWAMRLVLGQFAEETILSSVRAVPRRLLDDGFQFHDASLAESFNRLLTPPTI